MQTMWVALKICMPVTLMTFAVFTRTGMVVDPGWAQIGSTLLVAIATCATAFAMFGRFSGKGSEDLLGRSALALVAFVALFHPDADVAAIAAALALAGTIWGVIRHRRVAPAKAVLQSQPAG
jgi:TRAP-type uncharacterized transport system fused permease subunit